MNTTNTAQFNASRFASFASKELNEAIIAWQTALEARRLTKATFDEVYRRDRTYTPALGEAYDADREAVEALKAAHAKAQALYTSANVFAR
jgi:hypothetical protein